MATRHEKSLRQSSVWSLNIQQMQVSEQMTFLSSISCNSRTGCREKCPAFI